MNFSIFRQPVSIDSIDGWYFSVDEYRARILIHDSANNEHIYTIFQCDYMREVSFEEFAKMTLEEMREWIKSKPKLKEHIEWLLSL